MRKFAKTLLAVSAFGLLGSAHAQSSNPTTFAVTATVVGECTFVVPDLDFGNVYLTQTLENQRTLTASTTLEATCPVGAGFGFYLESDHIVGGSDSTAALQGTSGNMNTIQYSLYSDSSYQVGAFGQNAFDGTYTADDTTRTFPIYGTLNNLQTATPGEYADDIRINVMFD